MLNSRNASRLIYFLLFAICAWNLNGFGVLVIGRERFFSATMLALSLSLLIIHFRDIGESLGNSGSVFLLFLVVFYSIGALHEVDSTVNYLQMYAGCIIITVATAVATSSQLKISSVSDVLFANAVIMSIGACTVFLSPFLAPYYRLDVMWRAVYLEGRWNGFFINPNAAGIAGLYAVVACLSALFAGLGGTKERVALLLLLGSAISVCLTFSRGAILVLLLVLLLTATVMVYSGKFFKLRTFFARLWARTWSVLTFLSVVTIVYALSSSVEFSKAQTARIESLQRILSFEETNYRDDGHRSLLANSAIEYWALNPMFGHGLGSMMNMPPEYGGTGCHNTHIMILGESGVFGFSFYVVFMIVWLFEILKARAGTGVRMFLLGNYALFLANGMMSHNMLEHKTSNVAFGICLALLSCQKFNRFTS
jgi:O-antigen ligase